MPLEFATFVAIGAVGGFFAGLLGIGGGAFITPLLIVVYTSGGADPGVVVQLAVGTTMAVICLTGIGGSVTHARKGSIDWGVARTLLPAVAVGALAGSQLAVRVPGRLIASALAVYLAVEAYRLLARRPGPEGTDSDSPAGAPRLPRAQTGAMGGVVGLVSSMTGIGGGIMVVPMLTRAGLPIRRAIGTSSLNTLSVALFATAGYAALSATDLPGPLPAHSVGLVHLPGFACVGGAALVTAVIGARSTHALPGPALRRIFGCFVILVAARLAWLLVMGG